MPAAQDIGGRIHTQDMKCVVRLALQQGETTARSRRAAYSTGRFRGGRKIVLKKRNQIVYRLLTGMLIGGVATATIDVSAVGIMADEGTGDAVSADAAYEAEEGGGEGSGEEGGESMNEGGTEEGSGSSENTPSETGTESGGEGGSSGGESGTETGGQEKDSGSDSGKDTGTSSGTETAEEPEPEKPAPVKEESGKEESGSGSEKEQGDNGSAAEEEAAPQKDKSESSKGGGSGKKSGSAASGESEDGTETPAETGEEAGSEESDEDEAASLNDEIIIDDIDVPDPGDVEGIGTEENGNSDGSGTGTDGSGNRASTGTGQVTYASEAEAMEAARKAAAAKAAAEKEELGIPSNSYGFAYSDREYYSGSYFVSLAQKRLALNIGFENVEKVYGKPKTGVTINIREDKSLDARVIGTLDKDGLCYILEDEDSDWYFVESGEVRGFIHKSVLGRGEAVDRYVEEKGEENLVLAEQLVDPLENNAFRHSLKTTKELNSILNALGEATVDRQAMIAFSMQFLGNPYVWGGESLTMGCDCSGFTQQVYAQFGMSLPRCSYEQAEVGVKIPAEEAVPGDLLFYARDGVVYHVLMYVGDGKAINASSSSTGIIVSNVNYSKVCWACRYIADTTVSGGEAVKASTDSSTQASDLVEIGRMAYEGDTAAQEQIIQVLAKAAEPEYETYGFARSVIIAQAIRESGWCSFPSSGAGVQPTDNNVLGMNEDLNNSTWTSPWSGNAAVRLVPQNRGGVDVYDFESMRLYEDVESCLEDYAAFKIGIHPELAGETDVDKVISVGLKGYATDPNYMTAIRSMIDKYDLTRFDVKPGDEAENPEDADNGAAAGTDAGQASDTASAAENADSAAGTDGTDSTGTAASEESAEPTDAEDEALVGEIPDDQLTGADGQEPETEVSDEAEESGDTAAADGASDGQAEEAAGGDDAEAGEAENAAGGDDAEAGEAENAAGADDASAGEETAAPGQAEEGEETAADTEVADGAEEGEEAAADAEGTDGTDGAEEGVEVTADPEAPPVMQMAASKVKFNSDQLELIWAIVAEEDDTSYDGALAVISTAMNRADADFGGYGKDALAQLTAEGQYRYSEQVDPSAHYEKRLKGNVPDFVKEAVEDCLEKGLRNTECNTLSEQKTDGAFQIGANWYFDTADTADASVEDAEEVIAVEEGVEEAD